MYHFAVVVLLGLATLKVVGLLVELVPGLARISTLLTFTLSVVAAFVLDYSLFAGFGIDLRSAWIGTFATGLIVGSMAAVWAATLGYLGLREGQGTERRHPGRPRVAA